MFLLFFSLFFSCFAPNIDEDREPFGGTLQVNRDFVAIDIQLEPFLEPACLPDHFFPNLKAREMDFSGIIERLNEIIALLNNDEGRHFKAIKGLRNFIEKLEQNSGNFEEYVKITEKLKIKLMRYNISGDNIKITTLKNIINDFNKKRKNTVDIECLEQCVKNKNSLSAIMQFCRMKKSYFNFNENEEEAFRNYYSTHSDKFETMNSLLSSSCQDFIGEYLQYFQNYGAFCIYAHFKFNLTVNSIRFETLRRLLSMYVEKTSSTPFLEVLTKWTRLFYFEIILDKVRFDFELSNREIALKAKKTIESFQLVFKKMGVEPLQFCRYKYLLMKNDLDILKNLIPNEKECAVDVGLNVFPFELTKVISIFLPEQFLLKDINSAKEVLESITFKQTSDFTIWLTIAVFSTIEIACIISAICVYYKTEAGDFDAFFSFGLFLGFLLFAEVLVFGLSWEATKMLSCP